MTKKHSDRASYGKQERPQTPLPPFPYEIEEVSFLGGTSDVLLSGTLTRPFRLEKFPIVLLIAGYGPWDRNLENLGHKRFLVLADYLTRQGIGVLRFDKRGVGRSSGDYKKATSMDFADDVCAGIAYLKSRSDLQGYPLGLIGLSEGGLIASMVAARLKEVNFAVLMAPAVLNSIEDLVDHSALQLAADGASEEFIERDRVIRRLVYEIAVHEEQPEIKIQNAILEYWAQLSHTHKEEAENLFFAFTSKKRDVFSEVFSSPWYRFFLSYDIKKMLLGVHVPVLVVNGNRDWIAPSFKVLPFLNEVFKQIANENISLVELSQLNHLFQTCKTGALSEQSEIEETVAPIALETISAWILKEAKFR